MPSPVPNMGVNFGAILIAMLIATVLYGVSIHQVYRYIRMYPNDRVWMKALVTTLFLLDTLNTIVGIHLCYSKLIFNFLEPETLLNSIWSLKILLWVFITIQITTHIFYAWRIRIIVKRTAAPFWTMVIIVLLIMMTLGFSLFTFAEATIATNLTNFAIHFKWYIVAMFTSCAITDVFFAITTSAGLHNEKAEHLRTRTMINTLIRNILASGVVTSLISIVTIISIITMPDNMIYLSTCLFLARFNVYSVLANLNKRSSIRGHLHKTASWNSIGSFGLDRNATIQAEAVTSM